MLKTLSSAGNYFHFTSRNPFNIHVRENEILSVQWYEKNVASEFHLKVVALLN